MSRFQFVADHCDTYEVKRLCELVEIERSSYYAWRRAAPARAARAAADARLAERIMAVHAANNTYGAPRITAEINDGALNRRGSTTSGSPGSCANTASPGTGDAVRCVPRFPSRPIIRSPTWSSVWG